jgi:hypothetical protein
MLDEIGPIRGTGGVATAAASGICSRRAPGRGSGRLPLGPIGCAGYADDCTFAGGGRGGKGASGGRELLVDPVEFGCRKEDADRDLTRDEGLGLFDGLRAPTPDPEESVDGRRLMLDGSDSDDPTCCPVRLDGLEMLCPGID